jgi:serine/threonine protein kinase
MMARLGNGHTNIVRPLEVVLTGRFVAFVIEYVRGGSVSDFLKRSKMDEDLACYLFRQLLDAIAYCHKHKVDRGVFRVGVCMEPCTIQGGTTARALPTCLSGAGTLLGPVKQGLPCLSRGLYPPPPTHTHIALGPLQVAYRDIKPANCMLTGPAWPPMLKLAGEGLGRRNGKGPAGPTSRVRSVHRRTTGSRVFSAGGKALA